MQWYVLDRGRPVGPMYSKGLDAYDNLFSIAETQNGYQPDFRLSAEDLSVAMLRAVDKRLVSLSLMAVDKNADIELYAFRTIDGRNNAIHVWINRYDKLLDQLAPGGRIVTPFVVVKGRSKLAAGCDSLEQIVQGVQTVAGFKPYDKLQAFDLSILPQGMVTRFLIRKARTTSRANPRRRRR